MFHGPCSMDHVPSFLEAAASATSSAVTFDCERRDLAIPTSEATCGNLCKVGDVAIHDNAFASELHIAVEDGGLAGGDAAEGVAEVDEQLVAERGGDGGGGAAVGADLDGAFGGTGER